MCVYTVRFSSQAPNTNSKLWGLYCTSFSLKHSKNTLHLTAAQQSDSFSLIFHVVLKGTINVKKIKPSVTFLGVDLSYTLQMYSRFEMISRKFRHQLISTTISSDVTVPCLQIAFQCNGARAKLGTLVPITLLSGWTVTFHELWKSTVNRLHSFMPFNFTSRLSIHYQTQLLSYGLN